MLNKQSHLISVNNINKWPVKILSFSEVLFFALYGTNHHCNVNYLCLVTCVFNAGFHLYLYCSHTRPVFHRLARFHQQYCHCGVSLFCCTLLLFTSPRCGDCRWLLGKIQVGCVQAELGRRVPEIT